MITENARRLIIDLDDLRAADGAWARDFMRQPMEFVAPFEAALKSFVLSQPYVNMKEDEADFTIGVEGPFGANRVSPRELKARHVSQLVAVEGIVTKCSLVRPKVDRTVHYCEATGMFKHVQYHDATSLRGFPTGSIYPTKDENDNPYTTEFGLSHYKDSQVVTIQEMPERAPPGQLPCSVDVILEDDVVDQAKPGDRVQIIGIYRTLPSSNGGGTNGLFRAVLIANNVRKIGRDDTTLNQTTVEDLEEIRKLSKQADIFELLSRSVAPSIFGHDEIKKAIILLLLGGVEHNLDNGTHIRGDINLLMVGDPGTAKSQVLRVVLKLAPLAINTTGRGSSGVGLTAAVTQDRDTGERRLEAGAMVLGDRGVVCIDEFDKMSQNDRVAIHEVMEQQTVTIAKASIQMSLNARCSVVAAANPQFGEYDPARKLMENINLPDSLLSRFDLLFVVLDTQDPELDRAVADQVIRNHRFEGKGIHAFDEDDDEKNENEQAPVYQKHDRLLHSHLARGSSGQYQKLLSIPFLKKYIAFAKEKQPLLTKEAAAMVSDAYSSLRKEEGENQRTLPVTARSLETLIRLATAHAKAHLKDRVTKHDVQVALALMKFALTQGNSVEEESDEDDETEGEEESSTDSDGESPSSQRKRRISVKKKGGKKEKEEDPLDVFAMDIEDEDEDVRSSARKKRKREKEKKRTTSPRKQTTPTVTPISPIASSSSSSSSSARKRGSPTKKVKTDPDAATVKAFMTPLSNYFKKERKMQATVEEIVKIYSRGKVRFDREEVLELLEHVQKMNRIMIHEDMVHIL